MDELTKLKEENQKLKEILKNLGYIFIEDDIHLSKQDRLKIYMSYFRGRNDIYAAKYFSNKKGTLQYSPVCLNKFNKKICLLANGGNCQKCTHFNGKKITPEIILNHIQKSNNGMGIYPLLADNTCYFLVIDFDDDLWFDDLLSVYRIAKKYSISCVMEQSQSGIGGHLWIFFETPIKSHKARSLGDFLLKEAMRNNKNLSFHSFDRMFPSQDFHTGKGYGNCIALPYQFDAFQNKNSIFINELQMPITKPFHYLMSIKKLEENQVDRILHTQESQSPDFFDTDDLQLHLLDQIQQKLLIKENSLLHISKKGLRANTLFTIRQISSMWNPDYFKNLNLHLSVYNVPRVLCEFIEENEKEICIPRGLKPKLLQYIDENMVEVDDQTCLGNHIEISFKGALKTNQQVVADTLLQHEVAILEAAPGFGKTIIALYIMSTLKKNTLIIVNSKALLIQWLDKINEFINYPISKKKRASYIGEYHGNKKKLKGHIDVALIQSLTNIEDYQLLQQYGLILIDECHHASSKTYRNVLRNLNAKYIYSFSATPERRDEMDKVIYMYLGDIVYKVDKKELIQNRDYEQILIPRATTFKIVAESKNFTEIIKELYQNEKRNYLIIQDVFEEIKNKQNIIVLTDRKEHIQILYNQLKYEDYDIYCLTGDNTTKERKDIREKIDLSNHYLIIATSQLLGEGFDLPSLNTMFITMPISYKGRLSQYIGRLHRDYVGKKVVKVYDYVDIHIRVLQNMFQKRLKTYKTDGYKIIENNQLVEFEQAIFDKANYEYFLNESINHAKQEITIFVNECKLNRIQRVYSFFISLLARNIKIYICINKNYNDDIIHYLNGISTKILRSQSSMNAILIDNHILWTSSSSYLGVQNNDLFYLKVTDTNTTEELKLTVQENNKI